MVSEWIHAPIGSCSRSEDARMGLSSDYHLISLIGLIVIAWNVALLVEVQQTKEQMHFAGMRAFSGPSTMAGNLSTG